MNHQAIIARVDKVEEIEGATAIQVAYVLGEAVIVSKDVGVGYIGVFFPTDLQLSEEYCHNNNLYRDSTKNKDTSKKGFFDDNRRVRAQTFMKVKSCGYFAGLESLIYTGANIYPEIGFSFNGVSGHNICEKYISEQAKKEISGKVKSVKKVEYEHFLKHVDTDQLKYNIGNIKKGDLIYFHNKRHGTSFRIAKMKQKLTLPKWKQLFNKVIPMFSEYSDYKLVVGTRNVIIENEDKIGYNGKEKFRFDVANEIYPYMEEGMTVYGEIVGFTNGAPIMPPGNVKDLKNKEFTKKYGEKNVYHYGCKEHELKFHIYRITRLTVDGTNVDLSQKEMEKWCDARNLPRTFEVHPPMFYDGNEENLRNLCEMLTEREDFMSSDPEFSDMIGEGIILRVENGNNTPDFYKSKSFAFRVMEQGIEVPDEETVS